MARKKVISEPKKELELLVSPDEARAKLTERIEKGRGIREIPIGSGDDFKAVKKEYSKWDDFNTELLKRQFTTVELSNEYSEWVGS